MQTVSVMSGGNEKEKVLVVDRTGSGMQLDQPSLEGGCVMGPGGGVAEGFFVQGVDSPI